MPALNPDFFDLPQIVYLGFCLLVIVAILARFRCWPGYVLLCLVMVVLAISALVSYPAQVLLAVAVIGSYNVTMWWLAGRNIPITINEGPLGTKTDTKGFVLHISWMLGVIFLLAFMTTPASKLTTGAIIHREFRYPLETVPDDDGHNVKAYKIPMFLDKNGQPDYSSFSIHLSF